jgi:transglutaminase-like putative cysteine protease
MISRGLALHPSSDRTDDYTEADDVIDFGHPAIVLAVERLKAGLAGSDRVAFAEAAFLFVRDEIDHSADAGHYSAAYRASDVLTGRNAICMGKSHLLVAMLRAGGVPAGLCYQRLADDTVPGAFDLHGLVALRLNGRWSRLDPRGNKPGVDARFDLERERLAWAVDPERGEIDYPSVYASPPPVLLSGLRAARPGPGAYARLPTELPTELD